jgi:hypothetical protein
MARIDDMLIIGQIYYKKNWRKNSRGIWGEKLLLKLPDIRVVGGGFIRSRILQLGFINNIKPKPEKAFCTPEMAISRPSPPVNLNHTIKLTHRTLINITTIITTMTGDRRQQLGVSGRILRLRFSSSKMFIPEYSGDPFVLPDWEYHVLYVRGPNFKSLSAMSTRYKEATNQCICSL